MEQQEDEVLKRVLRHAGLGELVQSLPEKWDTNISDIGTKFSDGQRQRLAIARALTRDSQVLILDDATSALDSIFEDQLIQNILELYQDKILIVISHRLSSVKGMSEIVCLKDGLIQEIGDHKSLLEMEGVYWKLFEKQLIYGKV